MMKKILMSVYAACALLVIIGSLLWFVFTLHSDSAAGKTETLNNFKVFAQHTGEILSEYARDGNPTRLHVQLEQLCRNYSKYVQTILIKDSAGIVFIWPQNTDIFSYNEQYSVEVKNLPLFVTAAQTHIPIKETGNTVTVHAALRTLPIETVFNRGQIVFFLLLLIVLMTVMVLIFSYLEFKPAEKKSKLNNAVRIPETDITEADTVELEEYSAATSSTEAASIPAEEIFTDTDNSVFLQKDTLNIPEKEPGIQDRPVTEKNNTQMTGAVSTLPLNEQLESLNRLHIYDDERSQQKPADSQINLEQPPLETTVTDKQDSTETNKPETSLNTVESDIRNTDIPQKPDVKQSFGAENYGFFENHTQPQKTEAEVQEPVQQSAVTTFENTPLSDATRNDSHSLEQATLIEELTTAITETAVAEEDLTLLLIHATDIPHNQQVIHLLRSTLDRIHKVFIFNKDILGVIIFYAPLDQAMQIASTLYDEIHILLDDQTKKSLGIGLTTRAGRLIPAPRMIEEASAAISKATQEGGDPIVAFRVNPDKYRRCLARLS